MYFTRGRASQAAHHPGYGTRSPTERCMWERSHLTSFRNRLDPGGALCDFNEPSQPREADDTLVRPRAHILSDFSPLARFIKLVVVYRAYSGNE